MFDQLAEIITNYVEVKREDIKPESRFMEDLGFSSFDFMRRRQQVSARCRRQWIISSSVKENTKFEKTNANSVFGIWRNIR